MNNPFSLNRNVVFLWLLLAPGVSILLPQALFKRVGGDDVTGLIRGKFYEPTLHTGPALCGESDR